MLPAERVLLYALALSLGALLTRELTRPEAVHGSVASPPDRSAASSAAISTIATDGRPSEIVLTDAVGTPRLELSLGADGSPRLVMNDLDGRGGVELSLSNDGVPLLQLSRGEESFRCNINALGTISCQLTAGETRQQMTVQTSGSAEWRISGKATDPEAVLRLDPAGTVSWEFLQVGRSGRVTAAMERAPGKRPCSSSGNAIPLRRCFWRRAVKWKSGSAAGPTASKRCCERISKARRRWP